MTRMTALVLAAVTLSACAPTPTPSPTPTAAFASEEEAFAAAEEVYRAYIAASNDVDFQDPSTFEPLADYTTGDYYLDEAQAAEIKALGAELRYKPLWLEELVTLARELLNITVRE